MATAAEQPISPLGWELINDLSALPENEDIIIDYLLARLQHGQIYTWVGSLLLALNPCDEASTSNIYSSSEFDKYISTSDVTREEAAPHIFTVAAKAHHSLTRELGRNCQVIVISGETGSGKTFNACKCLEFLSALNKDSAVPCEGDSTRDIMLRITDACRLISAFTTACTERNEVSSRHGQLVRLHYKGGAISGATINSFLLERSRVTKGSSNFQIFYQMILGMSDVELKTFNLSRNEEYDIMNSIDYSKRKYFQEGFQDTLKALDVLRFEADEKRYIFQVLSLMIHMGNICFQKIGETCKIDLTDRKSKEALRNTCILSSLNEKDIVELLTMILINPQSTWRKHTTYHRRLMTVDACYNRLYSIIRHMYDLLFHWILNRTNDSLSMKRESSEWLGILDIFGFECFNENGIEQLCVNYANEKMQRYFMETYLEKKRSELQEEGFIDNQKPLDAITLYKERLTVVEEALFLTLNDACQLPVATETSTIIQLVCGNHHNVQRRFLSEKEEKFIIQHYSGPVAYSIKDLLSKNADKVPDEISVTFNASQNKFLRSLMNINEKNHLHTVKVSTKKRTMLAKLKYSMDTLIKELNKCDLHYVRCIKPSRLWDASGGKWDRKDFRKQLVCTGIIDALPLAKCKYPIRLCYEEFCNRYSKKFQEIRDLEKCKMILESIAAKKELNNLVHYGKRLIFLTESIFLKLESYRRNYRIKCAKKIQSFWRKYRHKKISPISKYLTATCRTRNELLFEENKAIRSTPERESNRSCNSKNDDDVFITSPISQESNNLTNCQNHVIANEVETGFKPVDTESKNVPRRKSSTSKKLQRDFENWQKKWTKFKGHFKDLHVVNFLKKIAKFMKGVESGQSLIPKYYDIPDCKNSVDVNCNDNLVRYDEDGRLYTIQSETCTLFYKNRILSRRRLAAVPIRVHTRFTCVSNSHMLPRCELPQGLQDCL